MEPFWVEKYQIMLLHLLNFPFPSFLFYQISSLAAAAVAVQYTAYVPSIQ